ncbi:MAG TPA: hypothetical protein VOA87_21545 [Thermoanaerobaculia bacterium]|nr:hypothetical protein [Thermoanaerobaculia bacterium]
MASTDLTDPTAPTALRREITERYKLEKILKSSRSGSVLRASDIASGQAVVVKLLTLPPAASTAAEGGDPAVRFTRTAAALAALPHPSLPAIRDFGLTPDGSAFLVMERLEGRGFESLAGGATRRIVLLLGQAIDGIELLASRELAHHNLSPDNLLVIHPAADGIKMLGLGTALFREAAATSAGENARFRAPEELAPPPGGIPAAEGWRSDLCSLALSACHVLGATVTFTDTPAPQVALPLSLGFQLQDAEALRRLFEQCLRRNPAERPTFAQARNALRRSIGEPPIKEAPVVPIKAAPVQPTPVQRPPVPETPRQPAPVLEALVSPLLPEEPPERSLIEETRPAFFPDEDLDGGPPPAPPVRAAAPSVPVPVAMPALSALSSAAPALEEPSPLPPLAPASPASSVPPAPEEEEGELLTPISDDFLEEMLARQKAPPPPPPPPVAVEPAEPAPPPSAGWTARLLRPIPIAAAGVGLLILVLAAWWWVGRQPPPAPPPAAAAHPAAPPPPPPPGERLAAARDHLGRGEDHDALIALRSLTPAEQKSLPPGSCELIRCMEEILAVTAGERVASDLAAGWKTGSVELLRVAVRDADDQPAVVRELPAAAGDNLERARRVAGLYDQAEAAALHGQPAVALELFAELAHLVKGFRDSAGLRDKAAATLETDADALAGAAKYDEALARLEPVKKSWPERPGLKDKLEGYRTAQKTEATLESRLASAAVSEKSKKPDEGLALLRGMKPTPHLAALYGEQVKRLEAQLAVIDQTPPTVDLRDGYVLDYDRGTVVNLSFRIRDDYKVDKVKIYARPGGGGRMVEIPYRKDGFSYSVEIQPSFHQNGTVDFYVVASDVSGHETYLGTREKPLQIKRKKGFRER